MGGVGGAEIWLPEFRSFGVCWFAPCGAEKLARGLAMEKTNDATRAFGQMLNCGTHSAFIALVLQFEENNG